ncbi:MAG: DoxX family protein, partial [Candidatus Macondimonas sp.]
MNSPSRDAFADYLPVVGRVLIAPLFIGAGAAKFGDIGGTAGYMQAHGMPLAGLLVWPAALVELVGGALLLLGWQ